VTRDLTEEVLRTKRIDGVVEALEAISGSCFPDGRQAVSIADRLAGLDLPILAIWGAEDRVIPPAHAGALPAGAKVETLDGAGHMPHMEKAHEVNTLVGEFLTAV
jgi:pyruvate dehydrogenase E2 component (dihydrolipoamide acetyltransferase)